MVMEHPEHPTTPSAEDPSALEKVFFLKHADLPRLREVAAFMFEHDEEPWHVQQVARLALDLFDQTKPLHEFGDKERTWLLFACLLHDIGWAQTPSGSKHHKISMKLILDHNWKTLDREETLLIANIARYHRKALPQKKHGHFILLPKDARETVCKLAAFLRVADGLDRTHLQRVESLRVKITPEEVVLHIKAGPGWRQELMAFDKKKDLFETVFGKNIRCLISTESGEKPTAP